MSKLSIVLLVALWCSSVYLSAARTNKGAASAQIQRAAVQAVSEIGLSPTINVSEFRWLSEDSDYLGLCERTPAVAVLSISLRIAEDPVMFEAIIWHEVAHCFYGVNEHNNNLLLLQTETGWISDPAELAAGKEQLKKYLRERVVALPVEN